MRATFSARPTMLALVALALTACAAIPTASSRTVHAFDITFSPSLPAPGSISSDQAIEAAHEGGLAIDRPPDSAEFGIAECQADDECLGRGVSATPVWLLVWKPRRATGSGQFVVDARSGEVLAGIAGP